MRAGAQLESDEEMFLSKVQRTDVQQIIFKRLL